MKINPVQACVTSMSPMALLGLWEHSQPLAYVNTSNLQYLSTSSCGRKLIGA